MKIIICFIIIIILLYFSFKIRENFNVVKIDNLVKGSEINIGENIDQEFANYSLDQYVDDYPEFKSKIFFYKFEKDSTFELTKTYEKSLTLGFYLLYPKNKLQDTSLSTTATATTPAPTDLTRFIDKLKDVFENKITTEQEFNISVEVRIYRSMDAKLNIKFSTEKGLSIEYVGEKRTWEFNIPETNDLNNFINNNEMLISNDKKKKKLYIKDNFLYFEGDLIWKITSIKPVDPSVNYREGFQSGNNVDNVLTINNGDDEYNFKTEKQSDGRGYTMTMTNKNKTFNSSLNNLVLDDLDNLGWFLITINNKEIKLSYQYNPYKTITETQPIKVNISNIKFNAINNNDRYVGRIMEWAKSDLSIPEICNHYYCKKYKCRFNLKDLQTADEATGKWSSLGNNNANLCIKECNMPEYRCNVKECQEMCIECNTLDDDEWTKTEKNNMCPWLKNIKIDMKEPQPPFIRGFPGVLDNSEPNNGSIVIEWKKPFNNMSKITHYLLLIKESLTKYQSHKVITLKHNNCDICEYTITNLKNQTSYEIELSAVNSQGISYKSNKLLITTNGENNDFLNNMYKDISGENESLSEYKCAREFDNSDHILDQVMDEDINVHDYVKSMQGQR
jgi:hypothetical protein